MKRIIFFVGSILLLTSGAHAHPPFSVEIDYIKEEGKLYVLMTHLSRSQYKHYIRKTTIAINGEEVAVEMNRQQVDPNQYGFTFPLSAKQNDEITVTAYSTEGGVGSATFLVPEGKQGASEVKARLEDFQKKDQAVDIHGSQESGY